ALAEVTFGRVEWAYRLPSLAAGLACIAAVYLLARRFGGRRAAATAGVFFALGPPFVSYSTQARGYSLLLLFSAASTVALLRALERPATRRLIAYVLVSALGLWPHLVVSLPTGGQAVRLVGAPQ